jgi:hypothetical protein
MGHPAASWTVAPPHPYFVNKILVFFGLRAWLRCKIVKTKELPAVCQESA